jgi:hypothetical protein
MGKGAVLGGLAGVTVDGVGALPGLVAGGAIGGIGGVIDWASSGFWDGRGQINWRVCGRFRGSQCQVSHSSPLARAAHLHG